MGDRVRASVRITGTLTKAAFDTLAKELVDHYFMDDEELAHFEGVDDVAKDLLNIFDSPQLRNQSHWEVVDQEANYGSIQPIDRICREHGLSYVHWSEAVAGEPESLEIYDAGTQETNHECAEGYDGLISAEWIIKQFETHDPEFAGKMVLGRAKKASGASLPKAIIIPDELAMELRAVMVAERINEVA